MKLMPPNYVKPYVKRGKTDPINEGTLRGGWMSVTTKFKASRFRKQCQYSTRVFIWSAGISEASMSPYHSVPTEVLYPSC
jgi:hypothetical protein